MAHLKHWDENAPVVEKGVGCGMILASFGLSSWFVEDHHIIFTVAEKSTDWLIHSLSNKTKMCSHTQPPVLDCCSEVDDVQEENRNLWQAKWVKNQIHMLRSIVFATRRSYELPL